jgi:hypothetical protein
MYYTVGRYEVENKIPNLCNVFAKIFIIKLLHWNLDCIVPLHMFILNCYSMDVLRHPVACLKRRCAGERTMLLLCPGALL